MHYNFYRCLTKIANDHGISLELEEFQRMVKRIRLAEDIMGSTERSVCDQIQTARKSNLRTLVASRPIAEGEVFTYENIGVKRPFADKRGSDPIQLNKLIGWRSARHFDVDDPVTIDDVK